MKRLILLFSCTVLFSPAAAYAQGAGFAWLVDRNAGRDMPLPAVLGPRLSAAVGARNACVDCATPSWGNGYVGLGLSASLVLGLR